MYMECRHIKPNGLRCESPALRGGHFCYYHSKIHTIGAEPHAKYGPLRLPPPEDPAAIQLSVARISNAVLNGTLDQKKAANLLYGLQIAAQFIDSKRYFYAPNTVQSAEQTADGEDLAPTKYVCKKEEECSDCPFSKVCPRSNCPDDDDEEDDSEVGDDGEDDDENDEDDNNEDDKSDDDLVDLAQAFIATHKRK